MPPLPSRPNLDHLKKQAKDLLRLYRDRDAGACGRFRASVPVAHDKDDDALVALDLRLHDAQSCIAREYGFPSWDALRAYVEQGQTADPAHLLHRWLDLVYPHDFERPRPEIAARLFEERPGLVDADPIFACAVGGVATVRRAVAEHGWVNRTPTVNCPDCGAALGRPPLVAVTHSGLLKLDRFRDGLLECARLLISSGADPNQTWLAQPNLPLSALYGAAGLNHDPAMTRLLLEAGANPNDNESLYHSTESDNHACLELLLEAGAVVEGHNALHHQLDKDDVAGLNLLLAHTRDANDPASSIGRPLLWAIRRRRSSAHVKALLEHGADPRARTNEGVSAYGLARRYGLSDIADLLKEAGAEEPLSIDDQFVAACASNDRTEAVRIQAANPGIIGQLSEWQLRQLPELAAAGERDAVKLMVELGWPIAVQGGDWQASALNLAVFVGDEELTRFLLEHGARWTEMHGYHSNVAGTLAWASRNRPARRTPHTGDWVGCAEALLDHGMRTDLAENYGEDVTDVVASRRLAHDRN